mgnify:CR=1 FL=1
MTKEQRLKKRHSAERRFRLYGIASICVALLFVLILVNNIFSNPLGLESFSIMIGTIAFGIQLYCDFSGYSDIAIGAAAILGFKIPLNFNE